MEYTSYELSVELKDLGLSQEGDKKWYRFNGDNPRVELLTAKEAEALNEEHIGLVKAYRAGELFNEIDRHEQIMSLLIEKEHYTYTAECEYRGRKVNGIGESRADALGNLYKYLKERDII
jgi:hypothetical protein